MRTEEGVYIGSSSDSSLTFGKKYIYGKIYSVKETVYIQEMNRSYHCWLKDDLGKDISIKPDNFCSLSELRDKQLKDLGL